jgi:hypothetical protein
MHTYHLTALTPDGFTMYATLRALDGADAVRHFAARFPCYQVVYYREEVTP